MLSPTRSTSDLHYNADDSPNAAFASRGGGGCCCFLLPRWDRIDGGGERDSKTRWWASAAMKVREWSELAAGPKWKTFIRRLGKNRFRNGTSNYGYDPLSYAMNFDETALQSAGFDEELLRRDFSARYAHAASIMAPAKSSMDLGRDCPSFS